MIEKRGVVVCLDLQEFMWGIRSSRIHFYQLGDQHHFFVKEKMRRANIRGYF